MKIITLATSALLASLALVRADLLIEQKLVSDVTGSNISMDMVMKFKEDLVRVDVGEQSSTIINGSTNEILNIVHPQKMIMKMDGNQLQAMQDQMKQMAGEEEAGESTGLTPTGNTKEIQGYETEEYTSSRNGVDVSYWIATEYPNKKSILEQMSKIENSSLAKMSPGNSKTKIKDFPGVPLETTVTQAGQKTSITISRIEQLEIPESDFDTPEGYREMQMPGAPSTSTAEPPSAPPAAEAPKASIEEEPAGEPAAAE